MRIEDSFMENNKCYIACVGPELKRDICLRKVKVGNNIYDVETTYVKPSIIGELQAMLIVDSPAPLPIGSVECII